MLEYVQEGDTIVVHSIDRLARSLADLPKLVEDLTNRGIHIRFQKEQLELTGENSPMQKLMLSMMGSFAEFERSMIKERGVYKGRTKIVDDAAIRSAVASGLSFRNAAKDLGVSLSTVQRAMKVTF
jgi:DNA invertase Pin-like site-specific DNA recombinase